MDFVPSYSYYSYYYIICMQTHSKDWICCKHELEPLNLFWSRSGIGLGARPPMSRAVCRECKEYIFSGRQAGHKVYHQRLDFFRIPYTPTLPTLYLA